ncbi:MAG TPA: S8 family serine peptidase [Elusimicrobiota bacterium]|nr:S8 family serine peptidase [Elusimicrobiota bacterium]
MRTPLLLAAALLLAYSLPARADSKPKPVVGKPEVTAPLPRVVALVADGGEDEDEGPKVTPPSADAATQAELAKIGWKAVENDALVRLAGPEKGYVPGNYLSAADLEWKGGHLNFAGGDAVDPKLLPMILEGLWVFVSAGETPAVDAGKTLASWGLPPVIDGRKLVSPDGSATYYGQMLRYLYSQKPDALKRASAERLSQALDLLLHAHEQAFEHQSADVAKTDVDRAELMLFAPPRAGETPFAVKPYADIASQLEGFKNELETDRDAAAALGDDGREKDSAAALDVLNTLERQHYHTKLDLPAVPKPGEPAPEKPDDDANPMRTPVNVPLAGGLPLLLRTLDRINGKPLTPDQQENLVKSFPMGDLVWRLGAQDLWRQGLTGKGVKVAVIDGGIGHHDELDGVVASRTNFTADRGKALTDDHGTHVAGIIHALAPDAQINGYTVFDSDDANPALKEDSDALILQAIDKAVKDGNRIVSMSLGGGGSPSDAIARKIEQYANSGVIFIVAAGNERDDNGVEAPAIAPNAISVGALDGAGRPADFSSYGSNYDARKLVHVVKAVFMTPGTNIYSTVVGPNGESGYESMDGTSMATPAMSGVTALLMQAASGMTPNPVTLSARVRDALTEGSQPLSLDKLPSNVPFDEPFLVVKPAAALDALRRDAAAQVAAH